MKTYSLKAVLSSILLFSLFFTNLLGEGNAAYAYYDSTSDLALLQPASTDSEGNSNAAFFGNDGDTHSRWTAANGNNGHWWQVDLQGYFDLNKIEIKFEKNFVNYKYIVQGSSDSTNWTTISDQSHSTSTSQNQTLTLSASNIRYVKITYNSVGGGNWAGFYDFKVYGSKTAGKNVALNAVAFADSEQLENRANYAVDGNTATRWGATDSSAGHHIDLDLGQKYDLSGSKITWEQNGKTYKYKIEVSSDHVTWQTALDKTGNTRTEQIQEETFTASSVRFVRLTVTQLQSGVWASIKELELFGTLSSVTNIASGKEAKADSEQSSNPASNGNDGSTSTRWCANDGNANHSWTVDFNGIADITGTEIKWEKSGVTYNYKIEVSMNNQDWTTVVDKTSNSSLAQIQTDTFNTSNVRFLRITVTGISGGNYASFYDFKVNGRIMRDESVLNLEAKEDFDYFWDNASTATGAKGLIREGTDFWPAQKTSISSTGFGLTALPIGVERGWKTWQQGYDRALDTLTTLRTLQINTGYEGHLYHYYDFADGTPGGTSGNYSSCILDTVIMMNGVIMAGEYFGGAVETKADEIFDATDWEAFRNPTTNEFYMEYDFVNEEFTGTNNEWNEGMLMHVYAAGSTTHPVANYNTFYDWDFLKSTYGFNVEQIHAATDFVNQYPQQIVDFRNLVDDNGVDWWSNGVVAAMNAKKFTTEYQNRHLGFGPDSWGLVACENPDPNYGYKYYASAPSKDGTPYYMATQINDGTISPSGPAGFLNMIPKFGTRLLDNYYYNLPNTFNENEYGFVDSFNRNGNFYYDEVLAYDKGIALQAIENNRTGLVWKYIMQSSVVQTGLNNVGFEAKTDQ